MVTPQYSTNSHNLRSTFSKLLFVSIFITLILSFVIFLLLYLPLFNPQNPDSRFYILPHINGFINSLNTILLILSFIAIKQKKISLHRNLMLTVFTLSILFFISYGVYHASVPEIKFGGTGVVRYIYYFILISHILTSVISLPLVLISLFYGLTKQFQHHRKIVRWAYPLWLYVAISGVATYLFLYPYYPNPFS